MFVSVTNRHQSSENELLEMMDASVSSHWSACFVWGRRILGFASPIINHHQPFKLPNFKDQETSPVFAALAKKRGVTDGMMRVDVRLECF
jgi:hypothetical protein